MFWCDWCCGLSLGGLQADTHMQYTGHKQQQAEKDFQHGKVVARCPVTQARTTPSVKYSQISRLTQR